VFGDSELGAREPFNHYDNCYSFANNNGYRIKMNYSKKNKLTNLKCDPLDSDDDDPEWYSSNFTISELEVWEVIFEK
jgi:hypothetical protein